MRSLANPGSQILAGAGFFGTSIGFTIHYLVVGARTRVGGGAIYSSEARSTRRGTQTIACTTWQSGAQVTAERPLSASNVNPFGAPQFSISLTIRLPPTLTRDLLTSYKVANPRLANWGSTTTRIDEHYATGTHATSSSAMPSRRDSSGNFAFFTRAQLAAA